MSAPAPDSPATGAESSEQALDDLLGKQVWFTRNDVTAILRAALRSDPATGGAEVPTCQRCGEAQSRNPHPQAGAPSLEFGYRWQCIPCLVKSRSAWAARAYKAEADLRGALATGSAGAAPKEAVEAAPDPLRDALAELVACRDLEGRIENAAEVSKWSLLTFHSRSENAWQAARSALSAVPAIPIQESKGDPAGRVAPPSGSGS